MLQGTLVCFVVVVVAAAATAVCDCNKILEKRCLVGRGGGGGEKKSVFETFKGIALSQSYIW